VETAREAPVDQAREHLEPQDGRRRDKHDPDREGNDIPPRRVADGEELGALADDVEEGLNPRQAPEGGEVEPRP
jgi:hypothetical protein